MNTNKKENNKSRIKTFSDFISEKNDPCWKGYKQIGTKKKNGKVVPNCVKIKN